MEKLYHRKGSTEEWNESYYFNFYDPSEEVGGFTRIGFKPNKGEGVGYLFLFYRKEILSFHHRIEVSEVPEHIRVGPLEFIPEWVVTFHDTMVTREGVRKEVDLKLEYTPVNEEFSYLKCIDEKQFRIVKVVGEDHYEQIGRVKGVVTVDSERCEISGLSERDHSWGERDWNAPKLWVYITAHFGEDFSINIAKMIIDGHEIDSGFIMRDGKNIPVRKVSHTDGLEQFAYTVWDADWSEYVLKGEILERVQIPYKKGDKVSILNENLSQFTCGGRKGFGITEYLVRVQ